MIVLDTNVLIFDSLFPKKLSAKAKKILASETSFACSDISIFELAMLLAKKRIEVDCESEIFIKAVMAARKIKVLAITPEIAMLSQSLNTKHKDPADLIIAATAIHHGVSLLSADGELKNIDGLDCVW